MIYGDLKGNLHCYFILHLQGEGEKVFEARLFKKSIDPVASSNLQEEN